MEKKSKPSAGLLPKWPKQSGLGQAEDKNLELQQGLPYE